MKKKIIYSGFSGEHLRVIDHLYNKYAWDPLYIMTRDGEEEWVSKNYPQARSLSLMKLRKAEFDFDRFKKITPLDEVTVNALSRYEFYTLDLLEDTTGHNFSFKERRYYYYDLLRYWNSLLCECKPDIFVSYTWPHVVADYSLNNLCKYYGIPVVFINPSPLFDCNGVNYHHGSVSLDNLSAFIEDLYHSDKTFALNEDLERYFKSIRSKEGMTPPYISYFQKTQVEIWNPRFLKKWTKEILRLGKLLLTGKFFNKIDAAIKHNKHPFESPKSRMNYFQYFMYKERIIKDDKKLKDTYNLFVKGADLKKKYIYYAAAVHPEAGIWSVNQDQLLILDMLQASIPDDWLIYYKEHPSQFMVGSKGSTARSKEYYERIAAYKSMRIVSSKEDTFKLIDAAQATVSPSGTVAWESIVRGTPALIFGHVWYEACDSVFKITSLQDCRDAIEKIKNGFKPNQADIERFAAAILTVSFKNIIHGDYIAEQVKKCPDLKHQMERIGDLLHDTFERYYGKK